MSDWQPIDSAPKDGTPIDIWCLDPRVTEDRYAGGLGQPVKRRRRGLRMVEYYWCQTHKCWRSTKNPHYVDNPEKYGNYLPMFWMPCPDEPELIGGWRTLADVYDDSVRAE